MHTVIIFSIKIEMFYLFLSQNLTNLILDLLSCEMKEKKDKYPPALNNTWSYEETLLLNKYLLILIIRKMMMMMMLFLSYLLFKKCL